MLSEKDATFVKETAERWAMAVGVEAEARAKLHLVIQIAIADMGAGATELTKLTGMSRSRIYQIRDEGQGQ
jgi:hypothetical protein